MSTLTAAPRSDGLRSAALIRIAPAAALGTVLLLQLVLMETLRNGAFEDEALYVYAGRDIWHAFVSGTAPAEDYSTYFSGLPQFYPVIAGWLDRLGGLETVRAFSTACALWLTVVVFLVARHLLGARVGVLASAVFAVEAPVLFIGRLATYDAFSIALVATALALATRSPRWWRTVLIVLVLTAAPMAKYATAVFVPSAIMLGLLLMHRSGGARAVLRQVGVAAGAGAVILTGIGAIVVRSPKIMTGLTTTTTSRDVLQREPAATLLGHALPILGPFAAVALVGFVLLVRDRPRDRTLVAAVVVFGTLFIAPTYHVLEGELTSFDKHIAFGMVFSAPLAGYALDRAPTVLRMSGAQAAAVVCSILVLVGGAGLSTATQLFADWPDPTPLARELRTVVRPDDTRVLSEEMEVPRYELEGLTSGWQYTGLTYFSYDGRGTALTGMPAYRAALQDRYFGVVVLRYGPSAATANAIARVLAHDRDYEQLRPIAFDTGYNAGEYHVWVLRADR